MQRIIMLGTGHGFVYNYYNTCFILEKDNQYLLVDTGGSIDIVKNLSKVNIPLHEIHDIFISHSHTDHLLGLFWIFKGLGGLIKNNQYPQTLNIYCNDEVATAIESILPHILSKGYIKKLKEKMNIITLQDNETKIINNQKITFFDVCARGNKLFGFETILDTKEKLIFLGDETCNPSLYERIKNSDYVMHEAFCLDKEADIFHPYEKNHSTVKSVCEALNPLNIKNLILFHTEDTHPDNKKELYMEEAKKYFTGNIIIPNDLETINLDKNT